MLAAAERLGVTVPDQLSVIGFDDIESAAFLGLSTVRQPLARSGTEGAQRLCALLRGERLRARRSRPAARAGGPGQHGPGLGVQAEGERGLG